MPAGCCAYCDVGRFLRGEDDDRERASAAYDSLLDSITEQSMRDAYLRDEVAAAIAGPLSACKARLRSALEVAK